MRNIFLSAPYSSRYKEDCSRYLFNATNLHVGGGVQVATSVICEWLQLSTLPERLEIWVSSEVDANVRAMGFDPARLPRYAVLDSYGQSLIFSGMARRMREFERVFTLFGPLYQFWFKPFNIVGFAQFWILTPDNEVSRKLPLLLRLRSRLKYLIQEWFFRQADILVVELDHVASSIVGRGVACHDRVRVVHNCLGSIYSKPDRWISVRNIDFCGRIKIGFLGRNYSHKNTGILPELSRILEGRYKIKADFYVTFTDEEWSQCGETFRAIVRNVGPLVVAQCPSFYKAMDAIIFPSLMECFSATPLEALAMERPLFASDRPFNRDVCGGHAFYFDPCNVDDAARVIAGYFSDPSDRTIHLAAARRHAFGFSGAHDRAMAYLALLVPGMG